MSNHLSHGTAHIDNTFADISGHVPYGVVWNWLIPGNIGLNSAENIGVCLVFVVRLVGSNLCNELITYLEESCWVCAPNCVWSRNLN